jgi:hypothetical protein
MAEWIFDALPPSGARRGGDPAEHALTRNLDTFVREVVQNANDQRIGDPAPEVSFRFNELTGEKLEAFLGKLSWSTLEPHLRAAARTHGGRAMGRFLEELDRTQRLLTLTIEDRHTVGLTGDESAEDSHFRALCKDTLYSHKRLQASGGSYGLGKSVLWAFSGLSTVLFNSVLQEHPTGRKSPRLIGRTELPSHRRGKRWFSGSGWFGQSVYAEGGLRAESIWHLNAAIEARELYLERHKRATGTSILLAGFRDPAIESEMSVASLDERILKAAARWFWPAVELKNPGLCIRAGERDANAEDIAALRPFVECWRGRTSRRTELEQPGDVVSRSIPVELPARRDQGTSVRGEVLLVVRLAAEDHDLELTGHVALFRGPGMVIKYWDRTGIAQGMRPFHAILATGQARDPGAPTDADREIERFLRDAEPPGHDDWLSTPALKESWKPGYAKALEQLRDRVSRELRELLMPRPSYGARGPERLQRRFPIGKRGGREAEPSAFRFADLNASFGGLRWRFSGTVRPARRSERPWEASVSLRELGDGGQALELLGIAAITLQTEGATATIERGVARIQAPAGAVAVTFQGTSCPIEAVDGTPCEVALEVGSRIAPEDG